MCPPSAAARDRENVRVNERAYQAVVEGSGEMLEVQPDVEGRLRGDRDLQTETLKALEDVVALVLEVSLQSDLFCLCVCRVEERDRSQLEGVVCAAVKEGTRLRKSSDEVLGADYPADTESGQTPVFGQAVDDDNRVLQSKSVIGQCSTNGGSRNAYLVDIIDVCGRGYRLAKVFLFLRVDVPRVELQTSGE